MAEGRVSSDRCQVEDKKIGKAQIRVMNLLKMEETVRLIDELKDSSDSEVTCNLRALAPLLRTPAGRGELISSFGAKMEEDRSSAVEEDEEDMSEDDSLALPCGTPVDKLPAPRGYLSSF